jgi:hypothetical protein
LLAQLDAIRSIGEDPIKSSNPGPDPPSDPDSSDEDEPDIKKERKPSRPRSPSLPPVINYHQSNVRFPEPPKFTGVGKLSVEKWLAQLKLYFEASGIRVK